LENAFTSHTHTHTTHNRFTAVLEYGECFYMSDMNHYKFLLAHHYTEQAPTAHGNV